jgi:hypothetical protein
LELENTFEAIFFYQVMWTCNVEADCLSNLGVQLGEGFLQTKVGGTISYAPPFILLHIELVTVMETKWINMHVQEHENLWLPHPHFNALI